MENKSALQKWRESQNLATKDAAAAAKVSDGMWSRWELGRRKVPPHRVRDIEALTGIPAEVLRPDVFGKSEAAA